MYACIHLCYSPGHHQRAHFATWLKFSKIHSLTPLLSEMAVEQHLRNSVIDPPLLPIRTPTPQTLHTHGINSQKALHSHIYYVNWQ